MSADTALRSALRRPVGTLRRLAVTLLPDFVEVDGDLRLDLPAAALRGEAFFEAFVVDAFLTAAFLTAAFTATFFATGRAVFVETVLRDVAFFAFFAVPFFFAGTVFLPDDFADVLADRRLVVVASCDDFRVAAVDFRREDVPAALLPAEILRSLPALEPDSVDLRVDFLVFFPVPVFPVVAFFATVLNYLPDPA